MDAAQVFFCLPRGSPSVAEQSTIIVDIPSRFLLLQKTKVDVIMSGWTVICVNKRIGHVFRRSSTLHTHSTAKLQSNSDRILVPWQPARKPRIFRMECECHWGQWIGPSWYTLLFSIRYTNSMSLAQLTCLPRCKPDILFSAKVS